MPRPLAVVFQELAQPTIEPSTPDLNSIIIGPAYELFDYPEDGPTILLPSTYGTLEQPAGSYVPPASSDDAVVVLANGYPGQSPGSLVDHGSVKPVLSTPRVVLGSTYLGSGVAPVLGTSVTTNSGDQTLVTLSGVVTDFVAAGVRPGDRAILTSSAGQTVVGTVASVGEPNAAGLVAGGNEGKLRVAANLPAAGGGAGQWTYDGSGELRIERELATQVLVDTTGGVITFPEPGTDKLVLKGGVQLAVALTPAATVSVPTPSTTTVLRTLSYAKVYLPYRALRQDLQQPDFVTGSSIQVVLGLSQIVPVGKIDARNPLAVGLNVALQNAGTSPIYYFGVASDDAAGHTAAREAIEGRKDLYCVVPLSMDLSIHAAYNFDAVTLADPLIALRDGVPQRFRITVGSGPLPSNAIVSAGSISGTASIPSGALTELNRTLDVDSVSALDLSSVLPGDTLIIGLTPTGDAQWQNRRGTHKVSHINANQPSGDATSQLELIPGTSRWSDILAPASPGDIELVIKGQDGTVKVSKLARVDVTTGVAAVAATGSITAVGGASLVDGETFTLNDGANSPTIFEFDSGGGVTGGHTAVSFTGGDSAATVAASIRAAINGVGAGLAITAAAPIGAVVGLTNDATGTLGNHAITETVANGGFTVTGMSGGAASTLGTVRWAMKNPTLVGGPYTVTYAENAALSSVTVAIVGFALTVTFNGTSHTHADIAAAVLADANASALLTAVVQSGGTNIAHSATQSPVSPTAIAPVSNSCLANVLTNDGLYNKLTDTSASFLSNGVKPGDVLEFPVDPNDYTDDAFSGRTLTYPVASVLSENALLIANGFDDTDTVAKELPHLYLRDIAGRKVDNATPNALNYRVRRALSKDQQVSQLVSMAQSILSKRTTLCWPDLVDVTGLLDGSRPRAVPTTLALAASQPGYYIACQVAGALAGLPPQQGLTALGMAGIKTLYHSQGYFREKQLSQISDGGWFVMKQDAPGALPYCIHQLTTDPIALETGELSVVKTVDFVSKYFLDICSAFVGPYNVLPETLNEVSRATTEGAENLQGRKIAKIGAPLLSYQLTQIKVADFAADRIQLFFKGKVPNPLNNIEFHLAIGGT